MNVNNSAMFMSAIGQQMAIARGMTASGGQRASLAQACDGAACDGMSPLSVWASGLGGLGSVSGDYNASTATYNFGGAAVGVDYRLDPRFLVGLATTYTAGNLWVNSFPGKGWSNNVGVAAYGSFTPTGLGSGFYADLLGGYALAFRFVFATDELDERNWCMDFGGLKAVREWLHENFDHTLLVAADDPELPLLLQLQEAGLASIRVLAAVGCEAVAKYAFDYVGPLVGRTTGDRVWLESVEVREHGGNAAIYEQRA